MADTLIPPIPSPPPPQCPPDSPSLTCASYLCRRRTLQVGGATTFLTRLRRQRHVARGMHSCWLYSSTSQLSVLSTRFYCSLELSYFLSLTHSLTQTTRISQSFKCRQTYTVKAGRGIPSLLPSLLVNLRVIATAETLVKVKSL